MHVRESVSPKVLVLVLCAACYGPDVPDCTLTCTADTDCVSGQACSRDGYCAASAETQCSQRQTPADSAQPGVDAGGSGSGSGSGMGSGSGSGMGSGSGSGTMTVSVHVTVDGPGTVSTSTGQTCTDDCTYQVEKGMAMTFTATASSGNQHFVHWTGACTAQPALCHVTPLVPFSVGAKFMGGG